MPEPLSSFDVTNVSALNVLIAFFISLASVAIYELKKKVDLNPYIPHEGSLKWFLAALVCWIPLSVLNVFYNQYPNMEFLVTVKGFFSLANCAFLLLACASLSRASDLVKKVFSRKTVIGICSVAVIGDICLSWSGKLPLSPYFSVFPSRLFDVSLSVVVGSVLSFSILRSFYGHKFRGLWPKLIFGSLLAWTIAQPLFMLEVDQPPPRDLVAANMLAFIVVKKQYISFFGLLNFVLALLSLSLAWIYNTLSSSDEIGALSPTQDYDEMDEDGALHEDYEEIVEKLEEESGGHTEALEEIDGISEETPVGEVIKHMTIIIGNRMIMRLAKNKKCRGKWVAVWATREQEELAPGKLRYGLGPEPMSAISELRQVLPSCMSDEIFVRKVG